MANMPFTGTADALVREAQRLQRLHQVPEAIAAYEQVLERWPSRRDRAAGDRAEAAICQAATPSGSE